MENNLKYISKVEIKGLWGKYDIDWDLNPDVNVLGGINGSGKSTVLKMVYSLGSSDVLFDAFRCKSCMLHFSDGNRKSLIDIETDGVLKYESREQSMRLEYESREQSIRLKYGEQSVSGINEKKMIYDKILFTKIPNLIFSLINTFDEELKSADAIQTLSDKNVRTQLDWQLYHLQKEYLNHQLNISKKLKEISKLQSPNMAAAMQKVQDPQERFLGIMDDLFKATDKKIDRDSNEIALFFGETPLTPYQLSSGEKQILVILLTVLVQDNQPAVLIMDEPEISLHIDWQEKLIGYIRELNPNVQVIIATHSPGIIIDGWQDKVTEMSDIKHNIQPKRQK
jgi:ABC-type cobalamin/Fe3+-siderophores transport system ATPase subunit